MTRWTSHTETSKPKDSRGEGCGQAWIGLALGCVLGGGGAWDGLHRFVALW